MNESGIGGADSRRPPGQTMSKVLENPASTAIRGKSDKRSSQGT